MPRQAIDFATNVSLFWIFKPFFPTSLGPIQNSVAIRG